MNYDHIIQRARERYELELTREDLDTVRAMIHDGHPDASLIESETKGSGTAENWAVLFRGKKLRVAVSIPDRDIFTLRPANCDQGEMKLKHSVRIVRRKGP